MTISCKDDYPQYVFCQVFIRTNLRISTITGLERLTELKVLNLAGNLIRKVTGVQNLGCVEELNLRLVKSCQT